jgi:hypothetical protein
MRARRPATGPAANVRVNLGEVSMSPLFEPGKEAVRHERAMSSLSQRSGAPLAQVRSLFAQEFSKLELGAKVRSYLTVLTASKVRARLRREAGALEQ